MEEKQQRWEVWEEGGRRREREKKKKKKKKGTDLSCPTTRMGIAREPGPPVIGCCSAAGKTRRPSFSAYILKSILSYIFTLTLTEMQRKIKETNYRQTLDSQLIWQSMLVSPIINIPSK